MPVAVVMVIVVTVVAVVTVGAAVAVGALVAGHALVTRLDRGELSVKHRYIKLGFENVKESQAVGSSIELQDDQSGCVKPPIDTKSKVPF